MTPDCPPDVPLVTVSRPLSIGLPPEKFAAVAAGTMRMVATKRNPRKDRYFCAKRPLQARVHALGTDLAPILRAIVRIEGTPTEWRVFL